MKIDKVINNNIVRSINEKGQEMLIMGCGLGFKKNVGDVIDESKIEKVYKMQDKNSYQKLEEILSSVTLESLQITNDIVDYAQKRLDKPINDTIYLSLSDHINFALERYRNDIQMRNAILNEIKRFYYQEYEIGLEGLEVIKRHTGIELPNDEAGFIALHFINAVFDSSSMEQSREMMVVIQNIINIIKYHFNIELDEENIHYERFITHLKFFVNRVFKHQELKDDNDESFYIMIKSQYKSEYACVLKVYDYILKQFNIELSNDEMIYLTIHIRRITTKNA